MAMLSAESEGMKKSAVEPKELILLVVQLNKTKSIFLSYETLRCPQDVDHFILAYSLEIPTLRQELTALTSGTDTSMTSNAQPFHPPS